VFVCPSGERLETMERKSEYDKMMDRLTAEGKVKDVDPKVRAKILEGLRKAMEDYRQGRI